MPTKAKQYRLKQILHRGFYGHVNASVESRPMDIRNIIRAIDAQRYAITGHADERTQDRQLDVEDIFHSVHNGEIIEHYPKDTPYPSCLIHGNDKTGKPVHSVWAYDEQSEQATLITVYRPNPEIWINGRERRKRDGDV